MARDKKAPQVDDTPEAAAALAALGTPQASQDVVALVVGDVVDASRLHVLCRAGRVESLFGSAPLLIPVVSDSDEDDDEAAFLKAASGALDDE